ncbi:MAG: hypothetical protein GXO83_01055 [Chlorobi bacterium]|nr:hypothetical protein [Chlorobiota bacterium]
MWRWWFILVLVPATLARGQITEDFESGLGGYWTQSIPGHWGVSDIRPVHGLFSLHHQYDNPSSGHDQISIPLAGLSWNSDSIVWTFYIRYEYMPSSVNNWSVFLTSDRDAGGMYPQAEPEAFVAGVNLKGSDDLLKLWKLHNGTTETIITTSLNWQETVGSNPCGVRVVRKKDGTWIIRINETADGLSWTVAGTGNHLQIMPDSFFGIFYKYSSQQDRKFWFDDLTIEGNFIPDTTSPSVDLYRIPVPTQIALSFNEAVKVNGTDSSVIFRLSPGNITAKNFTAVSADSIMITFSDSMQPDTDYQLHITQITDLAGNFLKDSIINIIFHPVRPFDVVINEIMADPVPSTGLPEAEYLELFNRTDYRIWMDHWTLSLDNKRISLPLCYLDPGSYQIICSMDDAALLSSYGHILVLPGMTSLKNEGMSVTLRNKSSAVIHHITYSSRWYGDKTKSGGGWSLEQIDPSYPCPRAENWTACSKYPGGTPGQQNSVFAENPDITQPLLANIFLVNDTVLHLRFDESYDTVFAASPEHYSVDHSVGHPACVILYGPEYGSLDLVFRYPFDKMTVYNLTIDNAFTDCSGNSLRAPTSFSFSATVPVDSFGLVINEILFNPYPDGADYVEIYNRSQDIVDLSSLLLTGKSAETGFPVDIRRITTEPRMLFPGHFILLTSDPENVQSHYFTADPAVFLEMPELPAMPDKEGDILLLDTAGQVIDALHYHENMHFPLIADPEGVALERIRYDAPSADPFNWHSASSESGYGTPGLPNSQTGDDITKTNPVFTEPEIFSPDNDGYHDYLTIHYHFPKSGNVGRVLVFNARGQLVRTLRNNHLLDREGMITWNGLDDYGKKPVMGIYLIYFEVFSLDGKVSSYKRTCVLAGKR